MWVSNRTPSPPGGCKLMILPGLGAKLEGHVGTDLGASDPFVGVGAGLTWRRDETTAFSVEASLGQALGRAGSDQQIGLSMGFTHRW